MAFKMGGEETAAIVETGTKRKAESTPPDGYVCRLCSVPGHWIQVCPDKKTGTKRQKKSDHVPVPGIDPSTEDIERARELQKITPPKCFCGVGSRLNKVGRSKEGGDDSRAIGKYFFFCSKKRDDETQCRFARPVDMELKKQKGVDKRMARTSGTKDKQVEKKKVESKKVENKKEEKKVCMFFAKKGVCKKGENCMFSHDTQAKKGPEKVKEKAIETTKDEKIEDDDSSSSDSSSSDSDDSSSSDGESD